MFICGSCVNCLNTSWVLGAGLVACVAAVLADTSGVSIFLWVITGNFTSDVPATIDNATKYGCLGIAYSMLNDSENRARYLDLLNTEIENSKGERAEFFMFLIWVHSGEKRKALNWLKGVLDTKPALMLTMFGDPMLSSIEQDPEYKEILNKKNQANFAWFFSEVRTVPQIFNSL